jgi:hypothetical protein
MVAGLQQNFRKALHPGVTRHTCTAKVRMVMGRRVNGFEFDKLQQDQVAGRVCFASSKQQTSNTQEAKKSVGNEK